MIWSLWLCIVVFSIYPSFYDIYDSSVYALTISSAKRYNVWVQGLTNYQKMHAYDEHGKKQKALHVYNEYEDALAALEGFSSSSIQGQLLHAINAFSTETRGKLLFDGSLRMSMGLHLGCQVQFFEDWSWRSQLGLYRYALDHLTVTDQTKRQSLEDLRTINYLTGDIINNAKVYGSSLQLSDWATFGVGDWVNYMVWNHNFEQYKLFLTNVGIELRAGLILPTGKKENPNRIMEYGYNYGGSWGIPLGALLHFDINSYCGTGLDFELTYLFNTVNTYRFKISRNQTELLLFGIGEGLRQFGLQQRLDLYVQVHDERKSCIGTLGYHYHKKGSDTLTISDERYVNKYANQSLALYDSTSHHLMVALSVDGSQWCDTVVPSGGIVVKIPVNGSNRIVQSTIETALGISW